MSVAVAVALLLATSYVQADRDANSPPAAVGWEMASHQAGQKQAVQHEPRARQASSTQDVPPAKEADISALAVQAPAAPATILPFPPNGVGPAQSVQAEPQRATPFAGEPAMQAPTEQVPPQAPDRPEEIVVTGHFGHTPGDPFEQVNAASFALTQKVDGAITGPAARAYKRIVPSPIRRGFRNFLNNLREPVAFANYVLQLKPGKAIETVGRFALNTTLGVGGVIDIAEKCPFNLPRRPNGFSETLGFYGVKRGPYLFVPFVGPTTVRDLVGGFVDRLASPFALGGPFKSRGYLIGGNIYRVLDRRAEQDDDLRAVSQSRDPYAARRDIYLQKRQDRLDRIKGKVVDAAGQQDAAASGGQPADVDKPRPNPCGHRHSKPSISIEIGRERSANASQS